MNENDKKDEVIMIPLIKAESDCARYERIIARLIGVIVLLVVCFTGYVVYDKWDSTQWDYADTTEETIIDQSTGGDGNSNFIGSDGDIVNGTTKDNKTDTNENENETK